MVVRPALEPTTGVLNITSRQYNCRACTGEGDRKSIHTMRIAPGKNEVPNKLLAHFKGDKFFNGLLDNGSIKIGAEVDEAVAKEGPDSVLKSKSVKKAQKKGGGAAPNVPATA